MTAAAPGAQVRLGSALKCAAPAMLLAALLLLPFLNTPFTIDDPLYLREAQHALVDPLHPQAFNMVWNLDYNLRASQILPGGIAMPYLLVPVALGGSKEWAAHLTELLLLAAAIFATALAALRLSLDQKQATLGALLTAASPAVLGIAGTVMPDIPAMLFTILGMERLIAWRDDCKWHQGIAATVWLTLAALTRSHAIVILAPAFVFLLDGISVAAIRTSFRNFPARFLPVLLTPIAYFAVSALTADPEAVGDNIFWMVLQTPDGLHIIAQNGVAFLAHWALVAPLTIPWLALRFRSMPTLLQLAPLLVASLLSAKVGWIAFVAVATLVVLIDILWDSIQRHDRVQLALWVWLMVALPVVIYIHLPSKYLLPSVPAAAILIVRLLPDVRARWIIPSTIAAGALLGVMILLGISDLAQTQRRAVDELIVPRTKAGERVWFAGHWGFQWYAELAGAVAVTMEPPLPQPGDTVVVSKIDQPRFAREWQGPKAVEASCYASSPLGRVMDFDARVGFFSSRAGYLPWKWGSRESNCFEVWKIQ